MRWVVCCVFLSLPVLAQCGFAEGQSSAKEGQGTGSVSGTITLNGKPVAGIKVVALRGGRFMPETVAVSVTDTNGQCRLEGLTAGDCRVELDGASLAWKGEEPADQRASKNLRVGEGEAVEGINIEFLPGGVITGRVTDSTGRPIIGESVQIEPFKEGEDERYIPRFSIDDRLSPHTDDRGIYRAYGLPAGRYKVSVGSLTGKIVKPSFGRIPLPLTYYSGGTEKTKPGVLAVSAGAEVTNVDIVVARPSPGRPRTYVASGQIVDDAGRPLANLSFSCGQELASLQDRASFDDWIHEYGKTNGKGEFTVRDLPPGRYSISLSTSAEFPWYSGHSGFEISNEDVEGLEIAAKPAGSISGFAVLEGAIDPSVITRFSQLRIGDGPGFLSRSTVPIGKDGRFKITGIAPSEGLLPAPSPSPGRVLLGLDGDSLREGFEIIRVERDGIEQEYKFVEVGPGENVSGVRLVIACYRGSVRGQITIEGGVLPAGGRLAVSATPLGQPRKDTSFVRSKSLVLSMSRWRHGSVDARGRFTIEHLPPGEYEITLDAYLAPIRFNDDESMPITITRQVNVTGEDPVEVSLVLDLSKKQ